MRWEQRWKPYVPVAQRRAKAARATAKMSKAGRPISPVTVSGRKIAATFWGQAWCKNLEAYSDYSNRLPRGRTYVRNGSVVDLQITRGTVTSLVSGSELYQIEILIKPLSPAAWATVQKQCTGQIDSLIEMLQGRLSSSIMQTVTRQDGGLFPKPKEITLRCSCPDSASLCKHLAASLYGVGARLDEKPELLFLLRGVDPAELISQASAAEAIQPATPGTSGASLTDSELADVFGIELEDTTAVKPATASDLKSRSSGKKSRPGASSTAPPLAPPPKRPTKTKRNATPPPRPLPPPAPQRKPLKPPGQKLGVSS